MRDEKRFLLEVRELVPLSVDESELMTLTEAAEALGLSRPALSDLFLRSGVERDGDRVGLRVALRRVVDTREPNPTKATRVFREDVERELLRRRKRKGDARLKRKRP